MTFKVTSLLSSAARLRLDRTAAQIEHLHRVDNAFLAVSLLRLARELRADYPDKLKDPHSVVYDPNFVWHVVPEIAKRLGRISLNPNEARRSDITGTEGQAFREIVGAYLANLSISHWPRTGPDDMPSAADLLTHDVANGNSVAFAVDRLYEPPPAGQDRDDYIARTLREISPRRGHATTALWSPMLQVLRPP